MAKTPTTTAVMIVSVVLHVVSLPQSVGAAVGEMTAEGSNAVGVGARVSCVGVGASVNVVGVGCSEMAALVGFKVIAALVGLSLLWCV